ncbi:uncharacterized protein VNE69_08175 [Vairimorpha necatrix]|uniref:Uncharacterized protein n=1 Tax=Vairimorpha necatrix TaxID=6039 RepID=A0AAX4JEK6_9MICR
MFFYILLIDSSELANDQDLSLWRPWENSQHECEVKFEIKSEICLHNNSKSPFDYFERFEGANKKFLPYKRKSRKMCVSTLLNKPDYLRLTLNFLKLMKKMRLKIYTNLNMKDYNYRIVDFMKMFQKWGTETQIVKDNFSIKKFSDPKYLMKYKKYNKKITTWLGNFSVIINYFLPMIKKELEKSNILDESKTSIIENIDNISRVMSYYDNIKSKNLPYNHDAMVLKLYYTTMLKRFPYLFDCFNLCERFINLYEMIIKYHKKNSNEKSDMIRILYECSQYLSKILRTTDKFLKNVEGILTMFDHLE